MAKGCLEALLQACPLCGVRVGLDSQVVTFGLLADVSKQSCRPCLTDWIAPAVGASWYRRSLRLAIRGRAKIDRHRQISA